MGIIMHNDRDAQPAFDFDAPQYAERKAKQEDAYGAPTDEWREAVYDFAIKVFLPVKNGASFIFEDLSRAYEDYAKRTGLPLHSEKRAYAGVQRRLMSEGLITVARGQFGRSYDGNVRAKYQQGRG